MPDYVIITDSTTDLMQSLIDSLDIVVEPMTYILDGEEYIDIPDESRVLSQKFYNTLREGKRSSTSQISESHFIDAFSSFMNDGRDVLYIGFSGALSGTNEQAKSASEKLKKKFPDRRAVVIDSLCASMGQGLLVYYAATLRNEGKSLDEVIDFVEKNKHRLCHWFTVDDLNHLKRGGRVSATAALLGTMLGIKPILHVDDEGRLIPVNKVRGRQNSLDELVAQMEKTVENPEQQVIFISHGDCIEDAKYVSKLVKSKFRVKDVFINDIGPVIGSHSGPGTVALFFLGSKR